MMAFTASAQKTYASQSIMPIVKHIFFLVAGLGCAATIQFVPSRWLRLSGWILLIITDIILYLIMIPGFPLAATINGATRWIKLGGLTLQPSEFAKLAIVIVVADLLSRAHSPEQRRQAFFTSLTATALTVFPILSQNLSTAILISLIVLMLWLMSDMPKRLIIKTVGYTAGAFAAFLLIVDLAFVLPKHEYHGPLSRSVTWCSRINHAIGLSGDAPKSKADKLDDERQEIFCRVAIARGGASPVGVGPGKSLERRYLPLADADCVFAILVEETGIVGATLVILLYLIILFRACLRSWRFSHYASTLMVMGLALMLVTQALISMMVVVGIGPVTGQPLPMISTGGTTLLVTGITFGVLMSVSREQAERSIAIRQSAAESREQVPGVNFEA